MAEKNMAIFSIAKEFNLSYELVNQLVLDYKKAHPRKKLKISDVYSIVSEYFNKQAIEIKKELKVLTKNTNS